MWKFSFPFYSISHFMTRSQWPAILNFIFCLLLNTHSCWIYLTFPFLCVQDRNVDPQHLAIDKPSHKFSSFLAKYYNLKTVIPQMNNFVVYDRFFSQKPGQCLTAALNVWMQQRSTDNTCINFLFVTLFSDMNENQNAIGRPPFYRRNEGNGKWCYKS